MAHGIPLATVDETPRQLNSGLRGEVQTVFLYNSNATAAWVKLYQKATTPTSSDVPVWQALLAQGALPLPAFVAGSQFWIAATANPGADLTAPAADLVGSLTFQAG